MNSSLSTQARKIWDAAVEAVRPAPLIAEALHDPALQGELAAAKRIVVVGGGKAGATMAAAVEAAFPQWLDKMEGTLNVPEGEASACRVIRLRAARPAGSNQPTEMGVLGSREMLDRVHNAGPDDVVLCLLSGGGSALLPAPAPGLTLADKQCITKLLHACGATINEMNCVRKHLSAIKGGRLAERFRGRAFYTLIISDVIGDPLDVIASGPSAPDPTTYGDALRILERFDLIGQAPLAVVEHLRRGARGEIAETPKSLPPRVHNKVLGNNARALAAAHAAAESLGYNVLNLGSYIEGETKQAAVVFAGVCRSIRAHAIPLAPPVCILSGGETTVTLAKDHGLGGRNQEFVLAFLVKMGDDLRDMVVLSGGTDGEDGPTDAAGAWADASTIATARQRGLDAQTYLDRNDAYHFFEQTGTLVKSGLTGTNVMDARVILLR